MKKLLMLSILFIGCVENPKLVTTELTRRNGKKVLCQIYLGKSCSPGTTFLICNDDRSYNCLLEMGDIKQRIYGISND